MTQSIAILGRQPALGLAELESLYGAEALHPISQQIALLDVDPTEVDFKRLGGTVKLAKLLTSLNNTSFKSVVAYIAKTVPDHLQYIPEGKIRLGLNVYGLDVKVEEINRASLEIKKAIKKAGRSVRAVPNSSNQLNSAQTLHNQLAGPTGLEFVIIRNGTSTLLAQVTNVQDINGYAARDQARPRRDAQVGMLPPKLAQTIINLSGVKEALLDPFCGTGVILQEATLMGLGAYGTDLEPRMTEYSQANLDWLRAETKDVRLEVGDADPSVEVLGQVSRDVDTIHRKFLKNLAKQTEPGFTASLAVPAWKIRNGFKHLPCLDSLEELGYTRRSFVHVSDSDLVYHRPEQIVGRELVVITRK
jgi:hypothetical protein